MKTPTVRMEIAARLQAAIDDAGLTQAEAGRRIGLKQPTINRYLRGRSAMPEEYVQRLARVTGFDLEVLLFGRGNPDQLRRLKRQIEKPAQGMGGYVASPIPASPAEWHSLTAEERAAVNQLIRLLTRGRERHPSNNERARE